MVAGSQDRRGGLVTPDGLILFCGMSIGYEDPAVSYVRTGRARSTRQSRSSTISAPSRV